MSNPLVSAIVPCYNAAGFLANAITSIRRQQYSPLEIIIVDDGSTDDSPAVAASLGADVRYIRKANGGPGSARNAGLREAQGELVAWLDADDEWPEGKLEVQVGRLAADPALDVVSGRTRYVRLPGALWLDYRFEGPDNTVAHIHLGAAVIRRRAFDAVGDFDESLRIGEDQDWFMRAREENLKIVVVREVTLDYQLHGSNMTRGATADEMGLIAVVRKSLERRRRKHGAARELPTWSSLDERRTGDE